MTLSKANANPATFSALLFEKMQVVNPGLARLELYEFRYCLNNILPPRGWEAVPILPPADLEALISQRSFYEGIQIKPQVNGRIVLDETIASLTQTLLAGLVTGDYPPEWVKRHFYFDLRGFYFLVRTTYFTEKIVAHLAGRPLRQFTPQAHAFQDLPALGYKDFAAANREVDAFFIRCAQQFAARHGVPLLLAIAGATAAGKTEIVERLTLAFEQAGQRTTSLELDNFFTDRDQREARGIDSRGPQAMHFNLLLQCLDDLTHGRGVSTPRYNFLDGSSSHDLAGRLKPGCQPVQVEPADIIFMEGNFPFLIEELAPLIDLKVVYLTDDPVRLKRKWARDMDFRRKYDLNYFRNRYFKDQFIMAEYAYRPQMEVCDLLVDTTAAAVWATPALAQTLGALPEEMA